MAANETGKLSEEQEKLFGYKIFTTPLTELFEQGVTDIYETLAIDRLHLREVASSLIGSSIYVCIYIYIYIYIVHVSTHTSL